jgi:hypothetical protein
MADLLIEGIRTLGRCSWLKWTGLFDIQSKAITPKSIGTGQKNGVIPDSTSILHRKHYNISFFQYNKTQTRLNA